MGQVEKRKRNPAKKKRRDSTRPNLKCREQDETRGGSGQKLHHKGGGKNRFDPRENNEPRTLSGSRKKGRRGEGTEKKCSANKGCICTFTV